jgi:hypothetical protein
MNDTEAKIKQQIVDKIKSSTNILITVSRDPSVDDLSATLGLTALLNKLGKHATAIFSGAIPPAITFLDPEKVFENTADSLRDFIIALDKEKADHLRYKVEGDVVKIFITPYRTSIGSDDLEFSQGDYNIELVLALGVENKDHLDAALTAQGGVLQDVTIATFSDGTQSSQLGNLDWNDKNASSLSEMVTVISDAFKTDKPILDKQIATALLTGIVAATDRFSNTRTTSRVMTTAAQLMAAGADQQLIAAKLQESHQISSLVVNPMEAQSETPAALEIPVEPDIVPSSTLPPGNDNLTIKHEPEPDTTIVEPTETSLPQPEPVNFAASTLPQNDYLAQNNNLSTIPIPVDAAVEPSLGGTLSATTEQAAEDARRELENRQNTTILSHSYLDGSSQENNAPIINSASGQAEDNKSVDIFDNGAAPGMMLPQESTFGAMPIVQPPKLDEMPLPPPLPDFSTLPPPPMPDFNMPSPAPVSGLNTRPEPAVNDPTKFRIPGQ